MLWDVVVYFLFFVMVVLPVYLERDKIYERSIIIKENIKYFLYVPPIFVVLIGTAVFAIVLSEHLTFLQWGWLGYNIVAAPVADSAENVENGGGSIYSVIILFSGLIILILAFLIFNYDEEDIFRDSWRDVVIWAVSHLIMGIPIFAVIPIFSVGVIYKKIKDYKGQNAAFTVHFLVNTTLISFAIILTIIQMLYLN